MLRVDLAGCIFVYHENLCKVVFANLRVVEDQRKLHKGEESDTNQMILEPVNNSVTFP